MNLTNNIPLTYNVIEHVKNLDLTQFVPFEYSPGEPYYAKTYEYQKEFEGKCLTIDFYVLYAQTDFETGDYKMVYFEINEANLMDGDKELIDRDSLMAYINIPKI